MAIRVGDEIWLHKNFTPASISPEYCDLTTEKHYVIIAVTKSHPRRNYNDIVQVLDDTDSVIDITLEHLTDYFTHQANEVPEPAKPQSKPESNTFTPGTILRFTGWDDWIVGNTAKKDKAYTEGKYYEVREVLQEKSFNVCYKITCDYPGEVYTWSINECRAVFSTTVRVVEGMMLTFNRSIDRIDELMYGIESDDYTLDKTYRVIKDKGSDLWQLESDSEIIFAWRGEWIKKHFGYSVDIEPEKPKPITLKRNVA